VQCAEKRPAELTKIQIAPSTFAGVFTMTCVKFVRPVIRRIHRRLDVLINSANRTESPRDRGASQSLTVPVCPSSFHDPQNWPLHRRLTAARRRGEIGLPLFQPAEISFSISKVL
jgi:hypothetical protein